MKKWVDTTITVVDAPKNLDVVAEIVVADCWGWNYFDGLYISVKCMDHIMAKVLIDNDYSLNVMPKMKLDKFPFDASYMRPSSMVARAFDGSQHDARGEIDLSIQIGAQTCQITFQLMNINPA